MKRVYYRHIIILVILGLVVGAGVAGLLFFARSVQAKVMQTQETTSKLALFERNRAQYDAESKLVKNLQDRALALSSFLVTPESVPNLLSKLEELAVAKGLFFEIQSVQTPVNTNKQKRLLVTFRARGSKPSVQSYFTELSAQSFLTHITSFSLATYEGEGNAPSSPDWMGIATVEIQSFTEEH